VKIQELIRKLERCEAELPTIVLNEISQTALDAKDMIQQRLQETGRDSKGNPFRPYSPEYQKEKTKAGKYKGIVDFTDENRMLNNIGVLDKRSDVNKAVVVVGARAEENRAKLAGNMNGNGKTKGRGDILELQGKEISVLAANMKKRFPARIKKALQ
jgi:hypothetical protein